MENNKYKLRERTPKDMKCTLAACPGVYEVEEVTPKQSKCACAACPGVYSTKEEGSYLIIGTPEKPSDFGLEKKVGENEVLISIPKRLIDDMERD